MDKIVSNNLNGHTNFGYCPVFGKGDTIPIDQQPVQQFNIDPSTGRPISDIKVILRSQGLEQERLLANLQQFREDFLPEDVTNEQALKYACPRLCQLPSELAEYSDFVTQKLLDEEKAKKDAEDYEQSVKDFEEFQKQQREKDKPVVESKS